MKKDPVVGTWVVSSCEEATVWCDPGSLAIGVNGEVVEDAS